MSKNNREAYLSVCVVAVLMWIRIVHCWGEAKSARSIQCPFPGCGGVLESGEFDGWFKGSWAGRIPLLDFQRQVFRSAFNNFRRGDDDNANVKHLPFSVACKACSVWLFLLLLRCGWFGLVLRCFCVFKNKLCCRDTSPADRFPPGGRLAIPSCSRLR